MIGGPALFCRFAFPPNALGYCGPADSSLLAGVMADPMVPVGEVRHLVPAFAGAWPYLDLLGAATGRDPLDTEVVEAYWLGSPLLEDVDLLALGNSMDERFRHRAGWDWSEVVAALNDGGRPTHSFHVFCIYPWVGLLQSGMVDRALGVLDRCRIRWGKVVEAGADVVLVESRPLTWDGSRLALGPPAVESVSAPLDQARLAVSDVVALHWDYVCQRISRRQLRQLRHYHDLHLSIANRSQRPLAARIEG